MINQILLVSQADFEAGTDYALTFVQTLPPSEATSPNERTLDHTNTMTFGGGDVGFDRREQNIVNSIELKAGYNYATRKFNAEFNSKHRTSIQTWGERQKFTMDVRTISGIGDSLSLISDMSERVYARYALPYEIIELDAATAQSFGWQVGDIISVTNNALPKRNGPGYGRTNEKARLYVKKDNITGGSGASSRLTMVAGGVMGQRFSQWAPSVMLSAPTSGRTVWDVEENYFSDSGDPADTSYFSPGDYVVLWSLGTTGKATYQLNEVSATSVEFTSSIATQLGDGLDSSEGIIMFFPDYDYANHTARQKNYVHMSSTGETLDNATGTEVAFRYS